MATSKIPMTNSSDSGYCKMGDGTLIQWGSDSISMPASSRSSKTIDFPMEFISSPIVVACLSGVPIIGSGGAIHYLSVQMATKTQTTILIGNTATVAASPTFNWFAIGRWE